MNSAEEEGGAVNPLPEAFLELDAPVSGRRAHTGPRARARPGDFQVPRKGEAGKAEIGRSAPAGD